MSSDKPSLFSSLTLGRSSKPKQPNETLTHPLLGASTSSLNLSDTTEASQPITTRQSSWSRGVPGEVKELPYKPRQKGHGSTGSVSSIINPTGQTLAPTTHAGSPVTPTMGVTSPPTTSMSTSFALPPSAGESVDAPGQTGSATSRLQLQSLKAAGQRIGLGNGSMGMAMIDAIFDKGQLSRGSDGGEWGELLRVLTGGKAILLLPTTPSSSLPMTPQTLRDHVAFVGPPIALDPPLGGSASETLSMLVTLSGLVGTLRDSTITIESTIPPDSPFLLSLRDTNATSLSLLRPAHLTPTSTLPTFDLSPESASLSFPPLGRGGPSSAVIEGKEKPAPVARRINPFASLFGASTPSKSDPARPPSPLPDTDASSILSDSPSIQPEGYTLLSHTLSKPLRHADVTKSLSKSLRTHIKDDLARLPDKVVERVLKLVLASICPSLSEDTIAVDFTDPTGVSERLQDFVEGVYDDLTVFYRGDGLGLFGEGGGIKRKVSGSAPWGKREGAGIDGGDVSEEEKRERKVKFKREREVQVEKDATEGTERVEGLICRLLYNRLFSPLEADDARHDEALASRIAALNMLELSLDHLGVITKPENVAREEAEAITEGLHRIVEEIGEELQKLARPDCLTPREKAEVLIRAHKVVVDGLSQMPPVELRPEGEPYHPPSPLAAPGSPEHSVPAITIDTPGTAIPPRDPRPSISSVVSLSTSPADSDPLNVLAIQNASDEAIPEADSSTPDLEIIQATGPPSQTSVPAPRPPPKQTSGADLILPIIIYAVVKANPPQLASQLLYLRRYRSAICLTGEASYAIVNLTAVVEFLEHVELADLGLGKESDKVISVDDLTPIGLDYLDDTNADAASIASASSRLRGRVFQVSELGLSAAGSANKVITGVVDSSWTALRGFISPTTPSTEQIETPLTIESTPRPGMRNRQASGFSLASVTASVANIAASTAGRRSRASTLVREETAWGGNQEMIDVSSNSRPGSVFERSEEVVEGEEDEGDGVGSGDADVRSIKSVSSVLAKDRKKRGELDKGGEEMRVSLSDRLANIGVLGKKPATSEGTISPDPLVPYKPTGPSGFLANVMAGRSLSASGSSQGHTRRSSLLGSTQPKVDANVTFSPSDSNTSLPLPSSLHEKVDPPLEHFMNCEVGDMRLADVGVLLRDYRRLGDIINNLNAKI